MSIESVMSSSHLILCHPLIFPPSIFPSIRVFSNESALRIRWAMYWSFSFNISSSNEYSGLISFRMDWLDLLAGKRTLKTLLQHHGSKASVFQCSVFFIIQLSHLTSLMAQKIKCLPTVCKTRVQSLGQKDLLEKEMATHSSILAWKIPQAEEHGRL